jgi:YebC/PmpR family DNA-binding regulatory protein
MSGHSKWSTIKHQKAAKDQKRGEVFSRFSRDISIAVREGGSGDPNDNPRLRMLLDKARAANMPQENIKRAVERGVGKGSGANLEEVMYEGYGPAGIAVIAIARTDNRQRTSAQVRSAYEQVGGSLGGPGACIFLFDRLEGKFAPKVALPVHEQTAKQQLTTFLERLQSQEDIIAVYTNAQLSNE